MISNYLIPLFIIKLSCLRVISKTTLPEDIIVLNNDEIPHFTIDLNLDPKLRF